MKKSKLHQNNSYPVTFLNYTNWSGKQDDVLILPEYAIYIYITDTTTMHCVFKTWMLNMNNVLEDEFWINISTW